MKKADCERCGFLLVLSEDEDDCECELKGCCKIKAIKQCANADLLKKG